MKKNPASQDWHRADIVAAIHKRGTTFQKLSISLGYNDGVLRNALNHPAPKYERQIAEFLGVTPQVIWPSRYHADGTQRSGRGERGMGRYVRKTSGPTKVGRKPNKTKFNGSKTPRNVNLTDGQST